jgi:hypothetical protein
LFLFSSVSAGEADPDWPCEQGLVREISAAVVWDGPAVEPYLDRWSEDEEIAQLVGRLTSRATSRDKSQQLIDNFAQAQPPETRNQRLTQLFAGVLSTLNADRSKLISGILRYSRDQQRRANALDSHLAEIVELEAENTEESRQRLAEGMKRIEMEQRIFDDREKSIPFLCTRPRAVEQRIGELARAIAGWLE